MIRSCVFGVPSSSTEALALERQQPFLVDQTARFDVAAAHRFRDTARDQEVVLADEARRRAC